MAHAIQFTVMSLDELGVTWWRNQATLTVS